jgi:hypothetical protein
LLLAQLAREEAIFVSKIAAVVLAFLSATLLTIPLKAQIIPSGNVYVGAAYDDSVDVVNRLTFRGWDASAEAFPFRRYTYLGFVLDGSGAYRKGIQQYNLVFGPRLSKNFGKWRPFVQVMGGGQQTSSGGETFHPIIVDLGGGVDRKFKLLFMHNFSWRLQLDVVHSHLLSANQNDVRGSAGLVWRF